MRKGIELKPKQLRRRISPSELGFPNTEELTGLETLVGQERATEAMKVGLGINDRSYNIYVAGAAGSGKHSALQQLLETYSTEKAELTDLVYVHNFRSHDEPAAIELPAGYGKKLKIELGRTLKNLSRQIKTLFESKEYKTSISSALSQYSQRENELKRKLVDIVQANAEAMASLNKMSPDQVSYVSSAMDIDVTQYLPAEQEEKAPNPIHIGKVVSDLRQLMSEKAQLDSEIDSARSKIDEEFFANLTDTLFRSLIDRLACHAAEPYLNNVKEHVMKHPEQFMRDGEEQQAIVVPGLGKMIPMQMGGKDKNTIYEVNVVVDNSNKFGKPVIFDTKPTFHETFGTVEKQFMFPGAVRADHMQIKAGSIHKARGGYLVLDVVSILREPFVYQKLMQTLKTGEVSIQSSPVSFFDPIGLKPQPVSSKVKIILTGEPMYYHVLHRYDPDFAEMFKVRADFEHEVKLEDKTISQYAKFVAQTCRRKKLKHFDATAVSAVVEQALRLNDSQKKSTLVFKDIEDLVLEADYWARQDGKIKYVSEKHIDRALQSKRYRSAMIDEKISEMIAEGKIMIDTKEKVVGQVNGLAVMMIGDYMFGKPTRITAVTSVGTKGAIHIQREVETADETHNQGYLEALAFIQKTFGQDKPVSFNASLTFEQNYGGIGGDSATTTEIYAMLSSLSGVPIRQGIAVTGSSMQFGKIQPVGGVTSKVEGFYDVCKNSKEGLTGEQGVILPHQNVENLMLRKDIVRAVEDGKFHIYAVESIEEGIEILTGMKAGTIDEKDTIFYKANERIKQINGYLKDMMADKK